MGLVIRNDGQHLLKKGGPVDETALISTGVASMSVEGIQHHCRTSETLVAYKAQLIMYCPQVVDDGPLILSVFATPWAVSITSKMPKGIGIVNTFRPMILGDSLVDTILRNLNPLGRDLRT